MPVVPTWESRVLTSPPSLDRSELASQRVAQRIETGEKSIEPEKRTEGVTES